MVPDDTSRTRRALLAAGGAAGALLGGGALARRLLPSATGAATDPIGSSEWPMAGRDPAGTAYAPGATPPVDGVTVRWSRPMSLVPDPDSRPSPVVSDGVVYAVGGELLAASTDDGAVVARSPARSDASPVVAPGRAYRSQTAGALLTPTFDPPRLVGFHGRGADTVAGVAADEIRWRTPVDPASDSYGAVRYGGGARPPPVAVGDALLTFFRGTLAAVDASSGAVRWRADEGDTAVRPAVVDGRAYVPVPDERDGETSAIRAYDVETGERTQTTVDVGRVNYLTAIDGGFVAAGPAGLFRLSTDGSVAWRESAPADESVGPVAVADDAVYAALPTEDGRRLAAVDDDGSRRWTSDLTPVGHGSALPAASAGLVCVPAADGSLAGVDAADGTVRWRFDPGGDERCSPAALVDDAAYVLTNERLYALEGP